MSETAHERVGAIVVGAGSGRRLGSIEKAFLPLCGAPLIAHSVSVFERAPDVDAVCLVLADGSVGRGRELVRALGWHKVAAIVAGGRERQDSVRAGLDALPDCQWVVVHDAARPLVGESLVRDGLLAARETGAAVAAIPVRDTLKRAAADTASSLFVQVTVERTGLWAAQTPQVFRASVLRAAYAAAGPSAGRFTDDASLVEATGGRVRLFPGSTDNIKVTVPEDLPLVEALLQRRTPRPAGRVGIGYDIHRLVAGRRLVLGGVEIPFELGLAGHSDGDVLAHAAIDALFGACGLPDIGQHFPPGDPAYQNADSIGLLAGARQRARHAGWRPHNLDVTLVCERPRLASYVAAMRQNLAQALESPLDSVSVKAKTNEGLDAVGRGEAIAAHAIILVVEDHG